MRRRRNYFEWFYLLMSLKTVENGQTWYRVFLALYDSQDAALLLSKPYNIVVLIQSSSSAKPYRLKKGTIVSLFISGMLCTIENFQLFAQHAEMLNVVNTVYKSLNIWIFSM